MLISAGFTRYDVLEGKGRQKMASWRHQNARAGGRARGGHHAHLRVRVVTADALCDRGLHLAAFKDESPPAAVIPPGLSASREFPAPLRAEPQEVGSRMCHRGCRVLV